MTDLLYNPPLFVLIVLVAAIFFSPSLLAMVVTRQVLRSQFARARALRVGTAHLHAAVFAVGVAVAIAGVLAGGVHLVLDIPLTIAALLLYWHAPDTSNEAFPDLPIMRARILRSDAV